MFGVSPALVIQAKKKKKVWPKLLVLRLVVIKDTWVISITV